MDNLRKTPEAERILERLDKVRPSGEGWSAKCPAHPDRDPSMTVSIGAGDKVLVNCHKGCTADEIVASMGLEMSDLWPPDKVEHKGKKTFVEAYDYVDSEGNLLFQVTRWMENGKKTFLQRRKMKSGDWNYSLAGIEKPIYRLPAVQAAIKAGLPIYVVEGEKDVHTLEDMGLVATTNPGGASAWLPRHTEALKNASRVFVVADNDAVGMKRALVITNDLEEEGVDVVPLAPPEGHKDVSDFVENTGDTIGGLVPIVFEEQNMDPFAEIIPEMRGLVGKEWSMERKLSRARAILDNVEFDPTETGTLVEWGDFLNQPVDEYDWVIPGLLERQERVIVVAAEGVGKTMLARQVALMTAAGISPFTKNRMEPIRTTFIDLENPERIIRRTSKKMMERIRYVKSGAVNMQASLMMKPDGVNLLKPEDRVFIERIVEQTQPDLLFIGPLYKAFIDPGGRTSESITTEVVMFLDYIRTTYDCALWLEHHAPFGGSATSREIRPFGSAVWSRWSEFGIALTPSATIPDHYDLNHYRGMRDVREWPEALYRGGDSGFPFEALWS